MDIISRQEALARGLARYYTGEACVHGHLSERRVSNFICVACGRVAAGFKGGIYRPRGSVVEKVLAESTLRKRAYVAGLPDDVKARLISRKDAKIQGLTRYFTGIPCPKGHVSERYVGKAGCCECFKEAKKANPGRKQQRKRWQKKNSAKISLYQKKRREGLSPEQRERQLEQMREWQQRNRVPGYRPWRLLEVKDVDRLDKRRASMCWHTAQKRGVKLPAGVTRKEIVAQTLFLFKIKRELEAETGVQHFIDHIVPICGGGTHEPGNLQVLSKEDHDRKTLEDRMRYVYGRGVQTESVKGRINL